MNDDETAFADALLADMARLGMRTYSEVGVPMFLIAEDLRGSPPPPPDPATPWPDLAELFVRMEAALAARRADYGVADLARLIEVFADRHLLTSATPAFTRLPDTAAANAERAR